jgi:hypothetical protein
MFSKASTMSLAPMAWLWPCQIWKFIIYLFNLFKIF